MNKVLLLAALTMLSVSAHASKARLAALQNATHLTDVQNNFDQPWQAGTLGELATVEFGTAGGSPNSEGGFVRSMGDGYLGAYVGHQPTAIVGIANSATITSGVNTTGAATLNATNAFSIANPINVFYAAKMNDINYGVNFYWENSGISSSYTTTGTTSNGVISNRQSNNSGISVGATNGTWDADLILGLIGKGSFTGVSGTNTIFGTTIAADDVASYKASTTANVRGGYKMDSLYYYGNYSMSGATFSSNHAGNSTDLGKLDIAQYGVGVINSHKRDGVDFFYGVSLSMENDKVSYLTAGTTAKVDTLRTPFLIGVEAEAASWLVLRGSISQTVLFGSKKTTDTAGNVTGDSATNDTTVAAGAGLKFGKFTLDTFIAASTTGNVSLASDSGSGDKFLTQASLNYAF